MKKSRPPDQQQADFKNKPFASLKGLVPSPALPVKKSITAKAGKKILGNDEDEASLFLRAVEGAKRVGQAPDVPDVSAARSGRKKTAVPGTEDNELFLTAMQQIGKTLRDTAQKPEREEAGQRSPSSRLRQLKLGEIHIGRELDLHGFLKEEALMRLEQFVAAASSGGQQAVLVITGKGINSPEGPVLQGAVAEWLRMKGKGLVAEFSPAPRALGGSGAFVVFLKMV